MLVNLKDLSAIQVMKKYGAELNYIHKDSDSYSPNISGKQDRTPLSISVQRDSLELVKYLINSGAQLEFESVSALKAAVATGNIDMINFLIAKGADVNYQYLDYSTPIFQAVLSRQEASLTRLIKAGASLQSNDRNIVLEAVNGNFVAALEPLHKLGADFNYYDSQRGTPLAEALVRNNEEVYRKLIELGAKVNVAPEVPSPLFKMSNQKFLAEKQELLNSNQNWHQVNFEGNSFLMQWISQNATNLVDYAFEHQPNLAQQNVHGDTALHIAAIKGDLALVKRLISLGANLNTINVDGQTALQVAIRSNHLELIKYLLTLNPAGFPNDGDYLAWHSAIRQGHQDLVMFLSERMDPYYIDVNGKNALHVAVDGNQLPLIQWFLRAGVNLELTVSTESGDNALHLAAKSNLIEPARLLLDAGLNINLFQRMHSNFHREGRSALGLAIANSHVEMVKLLAERKSDFYVENLSGQNALHFAIDKENTGILDMLLLYQADFSRLDTQNRNMLIYAFEQKKLKSIAWLYQTLQAQQIKDLIKDLTRSKIYSYNLEVQKLIWDHPEYLQAELKK